MRGYFCWQIYWLSLNLPAYLLTINKSSSRNWGVFLLVDLLTVTKSAGRFTDIYTKSASRTEGKHMSVTKSASRFIDWEYFYWQIYWLSPNLLVEMWGSVFLPADITDCHQIWQARFTDFHTKCAGRNREVFLPADLLTFNTQSASSRWGRDICSSRFTNCHQIWWQICWILHKSADRNVGGQYFCWQIYGLSQTLLAADLLNVTKICQQICWLSLPICQQKCKGVFLPSDLLTVTKFAGRFTDMSQ